MGKVSLIKRREAIRSDGGGITFQPINAEEMLANVEEADFYIGQGLYEEAIVIFEKLLKHIFRQKKATGHFDAVGHALIKQKIDTVNCELLKQNLPILNADNIEEEVDEEILFNEGTAFFQLGMYKEAENYFQRCISKGTNLPQSYFNIIQCLLETIKTDDFLSILMQLDDDKRLHAKIKISILKRILPLTKDEQTKGLIRTCLTKYN